MKSLLFLLSIFFSVVYSQQQVVKLWHNGIPNSIVNDSYKEDTVIRENGWHIISHVREPELIVYLPKKEIATGSAVVICPGGGYAILAMDHEGHDIARWLNTLGVAGIVLKYRLPSDEIMEDKTIGPLQDVQEAIRTVRRNAKQWNLDPQKIGVMGFSAGGHLAATASTLFNENVYQSDSTSARPDFSILIYPVISMKSNYTHGGSRKNLLGENPDSNLISKFSNELHVSKNTPPAFMVHSCDDNLVPIENSIVYLKALESFSIPAELHLYEHGGHGYGMGREKGTEAGWPAACMQWMKQHDFIR